MFGFRELVESMEGEAAGSGSQFTQERKLLDITKVESASLKKDINMNSKCDNNVIQKAFGTLNCETWQEGRVADGDKYEDVSELRRAQERPDISVRSRRRPCGKMEHPSGVPGGHATHTLPTVTRKQLTAGDTTTEKGKWEQNITGPTQTKIQHQRTPTVGQMFLRNTGSIEIEKKSVHHEFENQKCMSGVSECQCHQRVLSGETESQNAHQTIEFRRQTQQFLHDECNFQIGHKQFLTGKSKFQYEHEELSSNNCGNDLKHYEVSGSCQERVVEHAPSSLVIKQEQMIDDSFEHFGNELKDLNSSGDSLATDAMDSTVSVCGGSCHLYCQHYQPETASHPTTEHRSPLDIQSRASHLSGRSSSHTNTGFYKIGYRTKPSMNSQPIDQAAVPNSSCSKTDKKYKYGMNKFVSDDWLRVHNGEDGGHCRADYSRGGSGDRRGLMVPAAADNNNVLSVDMNELQRTHGGHARKLMSVAMTPPVLEQQHAWRPKAWHHHTNHRLRGISDLEASASQEDNAWESHTRRKSQVTTEDDGRGGRRAACRPGVPTQLSSHHRQSQPPLHIFRCARCEAGTSNLASRERHRRLHASTRPFPCPHCSSRFNQLVHLQIHQRTHTGEKPFRCHTCGCSFSRKDRLKYHERTHTGATPYPCPHCDTTFSSVGALKTHLLTHAGQVPYTCRVCRTTFVHLSTFISHWRMHS
ncbi:uncharacterized protein [Procambarus clarkii]|uniref:uncharacterized protein n=2 Tax=Procambarus clarkii TaxID=6728 RepID=UPI0037430858